MIFLDSINVKYVFINLFIFEKLNCPLRNCTIVNISASARARAATMPIHLWILCVRTIWRTVAQISIIYLLNDADRQMECGVREERCQVALLSAHFELKHACA